MAGSRNVHMLVDKIEHAIGKIQSTIERTSLPPLSSLKMILFVGLFVYGFELFNFNFSIDEEIHSLRQSSVAEWLAQGRWGMAILNLIIPYTVIPVISLLIGIFTIGSSMLITTTAINGKFTIASFLASCLAFVFPTLIFILSFSTISYGIGFGFLAASVGSLLFDKRRYLWSIILFGFAISIYQSFTFLIITILSFQILNDHLKATKKPYPLLSLTLVLLGGLTFYYLVQKLSILFSGLEITYLSNFLSLGSLIKEPLKVIKSTLKDVLDIYFGKSDLYFTYSFALAATVFMSFFIIVNRIIRSRSSALTKSLMFFIFLTALLSPFIMHLLNGGFMPVRSMVSVPFAMGLLFLVAYKYSGKVMRMLLVVFASFATVHLTVATVRWQLSGHLALQNDRNLAEQIIIKANHLIAQSNTPVKYFEVVGYNTIKESLLIKKKDTIGASFFEWDGGNPYRILAFLELYGMPDLDVASIENRSMLLSETKTMPSWPQDGSIAVINETIILKFGDYSVTQRHILCNVNDEILCN